MAVVPGRAAAAAATKTARPAGSPAPARSRRIHPSRSSGSGWTNTFVPLALASSRGGRPPVRRRAVARRPRRARRVRTRSRRRARAAGRVARTLIRVRRVAVNSTLERRRIQEDAGRKPGRLPAERPDGHWSRPEPDQEDGPAVDGGEGHAVHLDAIWGTEHPRGHRVAEPRAEDPADLDGGQRDPVVDVVDRLVRAAPLPAVVHVGGYRRPQSTHQPAQPCSRPPWGELLGREEGACGEKGWPARAGRAGPGAYRPHEIKF